MRQLIGQIWLLLSTYLIYIRLYMWLVGMYHDATSSCPFVRQIPSIDPLDSATSVRYVTLLPLSCVVWHLRPISLRHPAPHGANPPHKREA
jgi:hypothetical protein